MVSFHQETHNVWFSHHCGKFWWSMSVSVNSLEVEKWYYTIFYYFFIYCKCHHFLEIFITMFDVKIALCINHLHISYFFLETSCITLMTRQVSFQYSRKLGSTTSPLHRMRPFKKPCQRCCTALIQLRFTSKQDLMCSTVSWMEITEKNLSTFKRLLTIFQTKALIWSDFLPLKFPHPPNDFVYKSEDIITLYFDGHTKSILHI